MADRDRFNRGALLLTANACMFVFGAILLLMGSLLPSLQITYSQAGNLGAFPLAGILLATLLVGPAFDLLGAKPVFAIALGLIAASLATMSALDSYPVLASSAFAYGFGGGLLNTGANALVAELSASGRASALNLLGFFFSLGAIAAPLSLSSFAGNTSPSIVLRFLAVLCLVILLLVTALRFPPAPKSGTRLRSLLSVLGHSDVWLFAAILFFESGSENSMFVWAAKIIGETFHTTRAAANIALVALSAALGAGRLAAVLFLRWLGNQHTVLLSSAIAILGSVIALSAGQFTRMIVGMLVIGLGLSAIFPTALGMAGDRFPAETGTVFGAIMTVALIGGTAGPKLAGWTANFGIRRILVIPIFAATLVAIFTCLIGRRRRPLAAPAPV